VAPGIDLRKTFWRTWSSPRDPQCRAHGPAALCRARDGHPKRVSAEGVEDPHCYDPPEPAPSELQRLEIDSVEDVENIKKIVEDACTAAGRKVNCVVNYDAFKVSGPLMDDYLEMGHTSSRNTITRSLATSKEAISSSQRSFRSAAWR
jgi:hypothetical protein